MFGEENLENTDETLEVKVTDRRSQSSDEDSLEFDKEESVPAEKPGDPEELRERLEKLEARHQDVLNRLTRSQADLANVKRRAEMKASDVAQYANQAMAFEVLRVLDGFERAFASLPADLRSLTWIDGVALIQAQLRGALEAWG
ncbi:MAG TPA: nucleotide exchange factor GrpE, partial [Chloroflexi bacterium]|nr:nucleotide exchange factor GrpE [Chloroflexota bacterium]